MSANTILIIEDNEKLLHLMGNQFRSLGYTVYESVSLQSGMEKLTNGGIEVIIIDLMLGSESGLDAIPLFLEEDPLLQIIVITGYATIETAVEAMRRGAYDYIQKPVNINLLNKTVENAIRYRKLEHENSVLKNKLFNTAYSFKSNSKRMLAIFDKAKKIASTELPILITGESGTGKEVLADMIHASSLRRERQLVKVNSSAFSESLLESELFGHEKNSFTGAHEQHNGVFEQADRGTLFLDEIGDMSLAIQAKILRALQNHEIRRIGAKQTMKVDVRLLAATNKNIDDLIEQNKMREDLYYRINTAVLELPPLRERMEDIPLLIEHFLHDNSLNGNGYQKISTEVMNIFANYHWPGNIRELKNVIQYSVALSHDTVTPENLPPYFHEISIDSGRKQEKGPLDRESIINTLEKTRYNKKKTAEILGISRKTLYEKLKKYEIEY